jgi:hypothetical protein
MNSRRPGQLKRSVAHQVGIYAEDYELESGYGLRRIFEDPIQGETYFKTSTMDFDFPISLAH